APGDLDRNPAQRLDRGALRPIHFPHIDGPDRHLTPSCAIRSRRVPTPIRPPDTLNTSVILHMSVVSRQVRPLASDHLPGRSAAIDVGAGWIGSSSWGTVDSPGGRHGLSSTRVLNATYDAWLGDSPWHPLARFQELIDPGGRWRSLDRGGARGT